MHIMTAVGWRPLTPRCVNHNKLEGVFRPVPLEQAQAENSARADRFAVALANDQYGRSFRGDHFAEPISGAFGDKL